MTANNQSLFRGEFLRFTAAYPGDAEQMARFSEDFDYLRRLDSDFVVPQQPSAFAATGARSSNSVEFMLRPLEDDRLIGFVALFKIEWNNRAAHMAMGIGNPSDRGKGYGVDALKMLLRYAFHELNLNRVGLDVISYNEPAIRAYTKAGFTEEGRMRSAVLREGKSYDRIMMSILAAEWEAMQKK